jgi:methyl-accepting chemotaxis protein/methyl-accepting chemotaxis protein-1 (serine sensor receptor)
MGFTVVADEVRSLAQRSAQAAKDTASLIETAVASARAGDTRVGRVAEVIEAITTEVGVAKGLIDEIGTASRDQSTGIEQVAHAVAQMERVTQTTAATAEESAAASEELNAQAESSRLAVSKLEQLLRTRAAGPATRSTHAGRRVPRPTAATATGSNVVRLAARRSSEEDAFEGGATGTFGTF